MEEFVRKLENRYHFRITETPARLSGGLMHKMYALRTTEGDYALKLLNPYVMKRESVVETTLLQNGERPNGHPCRDCEAIMANYAAAEKLEAMLEARGIPILPALSFEGRKMQEIDGQYFYLFDYFDGKALAGSEITDFHCREMGSALAAIHGIDRKKSDAATEPMRIDWDFYIRELEKRGEHAEQEKSLYELLRTNYPLILESQENGNRARARLPRISAICHNDMDCKNVLWQGREYRIIDLECLSYNNPFMELFEMALCWSGYEECNIDFARVRAFLQGYQNAGGELPEDWQVLYDCNNGRLEWLEYNIKRVLGIDCGPDEKELGASQVVETIQHVVYYDSLRERIAEKCGRAI